MECGEHRMMNHPRSIAIWFIKKAEAEQNPLDQIKLMKLVYIAQGIALAVGRKLFEEPIIDVINLRHS